MDSLVKSFTVASEQWNTLSELAPLRKWKTTEVSCSLCRFCQVLTRGAETTTLAKPKPIKLKSSTKYPKKPELELTFPNQNTNPFKYISVWIGYNNLI